MFFVFHNWDYLIIFKSARALSSGWYLFYFSIFLFSRIIISIFSSAYSRMKFTDFDSAICRDSEYHFNASCDLFTEWK